MTASIIDIYFATPVWTDVVQAIAAGISIPAAIWAFIRLFRKNSEQQEQINKLTNIAGAIEARNKLAERRLRLSVKPRLWTNGGGYRPHEKEWHIILENGGHLCYIDSIELVQGDDVEISSYSSTVELAPNESIYITGKNPTQIQGNDLKFVISIKYHDVENYQYESLVQWINGSPKLTETKELP